MKTYKLLGLFLSIAIMLLAFSATLYADPKLKGVYDSIVLIEWDESSFDLPPPANDIPSSIKIVELLRQTFGDRFDFVYVFTTFDYYIHHPGETNVLAVNMGNLNLQLSSKLQSYIALRDLKSQGLTDLNSSTRYVLKTLAHEVLHRWGVSSSYLDQSGLRQSLSTRYANGFPSPHYGNFVALNSVLGGIAWRNNGNGTFTNIGTAKTYTPLDQYFMGLLPPQAVPPTMIVRTSDLAEHIVDVPLGTTVSGAAEYVTIDQIIAATGEQNPGYQQSQRDFKGVFVLVENKSMAASAEQLAIMAMVKKEWSSYFAGLTRGRASMDLEFSDSRPSAFSLASAQNLAIAALTQVVLEQNPDGSFGYAEQLTQTTAALITALRKFGIFTAEQQAAQAWLQSQSHYSLEDSHRYFQVFQALPPGVHLENFVRGIYVVNEHGGQVSLLNDALFVDLVAQMQNLGKSISFVAIAAAHFARERLANNLNNLRTNTHGDWFFQQGALNSLARGVDLFGTATILARATNLFEPLWADYWFPEVESSCLSAEVSAAMIAAWATTKLEHHLGCLKAWHNKNAWGNIHTRARVIEALAGSNLIRLIVKPLDANNAAINSTTGGEIAVGVAAHARIELSQPLFVKATLRDPDGAIWGQSMVVPLPINQGLWRVAIPVTEPHLPGQLPLRATVQVLEPANIGAAQAETTIKTVVLPSPDFVISQLSHYDVDTIDDMVHQREPNQNMIWIRPDPNRGKIKTLPATTYWDVEWKNIGGAVGQSSGKNLRLVVRNSRNGQIILEKLAREADQGRFSLTLPVTSVQENYEFELIADSESPIDTWNNHKNSGPLNFYLNQQVSVVQATGYFNDATCTGSATVIVDLFARADSGANTRVELLAGGSVIATQSLFINDLESRRLYFTVPYARLANQQIAARALGMGVGISQQNVSFEPLESRDFIASDMQMTPAVLGAADLGFIDVQYCLLAAASKSLLAAQAQLMAKFANGGQQIIADFTQPIQTPVQIIHQQNVAWLPTMYGQAVTLEFVLNPFYTLTETQFNNNKLILETNIAAASAPDLVVQQHYDGRRLEAGQLNPITVTVTNLGLSLEQATQLKIAFGQTQQHVIIPALEAQQSTTITVELFIPDLNDILIEALVDAEHQVIEQSEQNNQWLQRWLIAPRPDLAVVSSSLQVTPRTVLAGGSNQAEIAIVNLGGQRAGPFDVSAAIDGQEVYRHSLTLEPGAFANLSWTFAVTAIGEHWLSIAATAVAGESKLANNAISKSLFAVDQAQDFNYAWISPNGDGVQDFFEWWPLVTNVTTILVRSQATGLVVAEYAAVQTSVIWDGRDTAGQVVFDGRYNVVLLDSSGQLIDVRQVEVDTNQRLLADVAPFSLKAVAQAEAFNYVYRDDYANGTPFIESADGAKALLRVNNQLIDLATLATASPLTWSSQHDSESFLTVNPVAQLYAVLGGPNAGDRELWIGNFENNVRYLVPGQSGGVTANPIPGQAPFWDQSGKRLLWIDFAANLHSYDRETSTTSIIASNVYQAFSGRANSIIVQKQTNLATYRLSANGQELALPLPALSTGSNLYGELLQVILAANNRSEFLVLSSDSGNVVVYVSEADNDYQVVWLSAFTKQIAPRADGKAFAYLDKDSETARVFVVNLAGRIETVAAEWMYCPPQPQDIEAACVYAPKNKPAFPQELFWNGTEPFLFVSAGHGPWILDLTSGDFIQQVFSDVLHRDLSLKSFFANPSLANRLYVFHGNQINLRRVHTNENMQFAFKAAATTEAVHIFTEAQDRNFASHKLEFRRLDLDAAWTPLNIDPDAHHYKHSLAWIPPAPGLYELKFSVKDLAGNQKANSQIVSWQHTPTLISNAALDVAAISPNADGRQDKVTIEFDLAFAATVTANIFSENGLLVRQLVASFDRAGRQKLFWDGRHENLSIIDGSYAIQIGGSLLRIIVDRQPPQLSIVPSQLFLSCPLDAIYGNLINPAGRTGQFIVGAAAGTDFDFKRFITEHKLELAARQARISTAYSSHNCVAKATTPYVRLAAVTVNDPLSGVSYANLAPHSSAKALAGLPQFFAAPKVVTLATILPEQNLKLEVRDLAGNEAQTAYNVDSRLLAIGLHFNEHDQDKEIFILPSTAMTAAIQINPAAAQFLQFNLQWAHPATLTSIVFEPRGGAGLARREFYFFEQVQQAATIKVNLPLATYVYGHYRLVLHFADGTQLSSPEFKLDQQLQKQEQFNVCGSSLASSNNSVTLIDIDKFLEKNKGWTVKIGKVHILERAYFDWIDAILHFPNNEFERVPLFFENRNENLVIDDLRDGSEYFCEFYDAHNKTLILSEVIDWFALNELKASLQIGEGSAARVFSMQHGALIPDLPDYQYNQTWTAPLSESIIAEICQARPAVLVRLQGQANNSIAVRRGWRGPRQVTAAASLIPNPICGLALVSPSVGSVAHPDQAIVFNPGNRHHEQVEFYISANQAAKPGSAVVSQAIVVPAGAASTRIAPIVWPSPPPIPDFDYAVVGSNSFGQYFDIDGMALEHSQAITKTVAFGLRNKNYSGAQGHYEVFLKAGQSVCSPSTTRCSNHLSFNLPPQRVFLKTTRSALCNEPLTERTFRSNIASDYVDSLLRYRPSVFDAASGTEIPILSRTWDNELTIQLHQVSPGFRELLFYWTRPQIDELDDLPRQLWERVQVYVPQHRARFETVASSACPVQLPNGALAAQLAIDMFDLIAGPSQLNATLCSTQARVGPTEQFCSKVKLDKKGVRLANDFYLATRYAANLNLGDPLIHRVFAAAPVSMHVQAFDSEDNLICANFGDLDIDTAVKHDGDLLTNSAISPLNADDQFDSADYIIEPAEPLRAFLDLLLLQQPQQIYNVAVNRSLQVAEDSLKIAGVSLQGIIPDGEYQVKVKLIDHCGNQKILDTKKIRLDNTAPALNFISPLDGATIAAGKPIELKINATDASLPLRNLKLMAYAADEQIQQDLKVYSSFPGNRQLNALYFANSTGAVQFVVQGHDDVFNGPVSAQILVNAVPTKIIAGVDFENNVFSPNGDGVRDQFSAQLLLKRSASLTANIRQNDVNTLALVADQAEVLQPKLIWNGADGNNTIADGSYQLWIVATANIAGHEFSEEISSALVVDRTLPTSQFFTPDKGYINDTSLQFSAVVSDNFSLADSRLTVQGPTDNWFREGLDRLDLPILGAVDGRYDWQLEVNDLAGNRLQRNGYVQLDRLPPHFDDIAIAPAEITLPGELVAINGRIIDASPVTVFAFIDKAEGQVPVSATVTAGQFYLPLAYENYRGSIGQISGSLWAVDAAGNRSGLPITIPLRTTSVFAEFAAPLSHAVAPFTVIAGNIAADEFSTARLLLAAQNAGFSEIAVLAGPFAGIVNLGIVPYALSGHYRLRLVVENAYATAVSEIEIVIDSEPPILPTALSGIAVSQGLRLTWQGDASATTDIYRDGLLVASVQGLTYLDHLPNDGYYNYQLRARDAVGNLSDLSPKATILLDRQPPELGNIQLSPGPVVAGDLKLELTLQDLFSANVDYFVQLGNGTPEIATLPSGSRVRLALMPPAQEGAIPLFISAVDASGNQTSTTLLLAVDLTPPLAPTALTYEVIDFDILLSWAASLSTDVVGYRIVRNGQAMGASGYPIGYQETFNAQAYKDQDAHPDGIYRYEVYAIDRAGLASAPATIVVSKQQSPPAVLLLNPPQVSFWEQPFGFSQTLNVHVASSDRDLDRIQIQWAMDYWYDQNLGEITRATWQTAATLVGSARRTQLTWPYGPGAANVALRAVAYDVLGQQGLAGPTHLRHLREDVPPPVEFATVGHHSGVVEASWIHNVTEAVQYSIYRARAGRPFSQADFVLVSSSPFFEDFVGSGQWEYWLRSNFGDGIQGPPERIGQVDIYEPILDPFLAYSASPTLSIGGYARALATMTATLYDANANVFAVYQAPADHVGRFDLQLELNPGAYSLVLYASDEFENQSLEVYTGLVRLNPPSMPSDLTHHVVGADVEYSWQAPSEPSAGYLLSVNGRAINQVVNPQHWDGIVTSHQAPSQAALSAAFDGRRDTYWSISAFPSQVQWLSYSSPRMVSQVVLTFQEPYLPQSVNIVGVVGQSEQAYLRLYHGIVTQSTLQLRWPDYLAIQSLQLDFSPPSMGIGEVRLSEISFAGYVPIATNSYLLAASSQTLATTVQAFGTFGGLGAAASWQPIELNIASPPPPIWVHALYEDNSISLQWQNSDAAISGTTIERNTGQDFAILNFSRHNSYVDNINTAGRHIYRLRAIDRFGQVSPYSETAVVDVPQDPPGLSPVVFAAPTIRQQYESETNASALALSLVGTAPIHVHMNEQIAVVVTPSTNPEVHALGMVDANALATFLSPSASRLAILYDGPPRLVVRDRRTSRLLTTVSLPSANVSQVLWSLYEQGLLLSWHNNGEAMLAVVDLKNARISQIGVGYGGAWLDDRLLLFVDENLGLPIIKMYDADHDISSIVAFPDHKPQHLAVDPVRGQLWLTLSNPQAVLQTIDIFSGVVSQVESGFVIDDLQLLSPLGLAYYRILANAGSQAKWRAVSLDSAALFVTNVAVDADQTYLTWLPTAFGDYVVVNPGQALTPLPTQRNNYASLSYYNQLPAQLTAATYSAEFPENLIIDSLDFQINMMHTALAQMLIELVSPSGQSVRLHDHQAGLGTFLSGIYPYWLTPLDSLDTFVGANARGIWSLRLTVNQPGSSGWLSDWQLNVYGHVDDLQTVLGYEQTLTYVVAGKTQTLSITTPTSRPWSCLGPYCSIVGWNGAYVAKAPHIAEVNIGLPKTQTVVIKPSQHNSRGQISIAEHQLTLHRQLPRVELQLKHLTLIPDRVAPAAIVRGSAIIHNLGDLDLSELKIVGQPAGLLTAMNIERLAAGASRPLVFEFAAPVTAGRYDLKLEVRAQQLSQPIVSEARVLFVSETQAPLASLQLSKAQALWGERIEFTGLVAQGSAGSALTASVDLLNANGRVVLPNIFAAHYDLAAGERRNLSGSFIVPNLADGEYHLRLTVRNLTGASVLAIAPLRVLASAQVAAAFFRYPSQVKPGDLITLRLTVDNLGYVMQNHLSAVFSFEPTTDLTLMQTAFVPPILPGGTKDVVATFVVPNNAKPGQYTPTVNLLYQGQQLNRFKTDKVTIIGVPQAHYDLKAPAAVAPQSSVDVTVTVSSIGSGSVSDRLVLELRSNTQILDSVTLPPYTLEPGQSVTYSAIFLLVNQPLGEYHIALRNQLGQVVLWRDILNADTTPPFIRIDAPQAFDVIPSAASVVVFVNDGDSGIWSCSATNQTSQNERRFNSIVYGTTCFLPLVFANEGIQTVVASAKNNYGYESSASVQVIVDKTPPLIAVSGVADGGLYANAATLFVSVADLHLANVTMFLDGLPLLDFSQSITASGIHVLTVEAIDQAGNRSQKTLVFAIDGQAPTLAFTPPAGRYPQGVTVDVFVNDDFFAELAVYLDGVLLEPPLELSAIGVYHVTAVAVDMVGHQSLGSSTYVVDQTALPIFVEIYSPYAGLLTNQNVSIDYSVTGGIDPVVIARLNEQIYQADQVTTAGVYHLSITAFDASGAVSSASRNFVIDRTPPHVNIVGVSDGLVSALDLEIVVLTSDDWPPLSVVSHVNGQPFSGSINLSAEGEYSLAVQAKDAAGNLSQAQLNFVIDRTSPVIQVAGVSYDQVITNQARIEYVVNDSNLVSVVATLDGMPQLTPAFTVSTSGMHILEILALDAAGNQAITTIVFGVDADLPSITILPAAGYYNSILHVSVDVDDEFTVTAATLLNHQVVADLYALSLTQAGVYLVQVIAVDQVGHTVTAQNIYYLDFEPPLLAFVSPLADAHFRLPVNLQLSISDASPVTYVQVYVDGQIWSGGNISTEGLHQVLAIAADAAGNVTMAAVDFVIDTTPPELLFNGVVNDTVSRGPVTLAVEASDLYLASIKAYANGQPFSNSIVLNAEGLYNIQVTASDLAGNITSRLLSFAIDRTPPDLRLLPLDLDGSYRNTSIVVQAVANDPHLVGVNIYNNGIWTAGSVVTASSQGLQAISATADDLAGNRAFALINFVIDSQPPLLSITGVSANGSYAFVATPYVSIYDLNLLSSQILLNGQPFVSGTAVTAIGQHSLLAAATDLAGNTTTASVVFSVIAADVVTNIVTVPAIADTYIREGASNKNYGSESHMRVRESGPNRGLIRFANTALSAALGGKSLMSAKLRLYVIDNGHNWSNDGRSVTVHRVWRHWLEANATWNCPNDPVPTNSGMDGCLPWDMENDSLWPFARNDSSRVVQYNNQLGWKEWEVGADVLLYALGVTQNYGWLVRKFDESQPGRVDYSTKEGSYPPQLRLVTIVSGNIWPVAPDYSFKTSINTPIYTVLAASDANQTPLIYQIVTPSPNLSVQVVDPLRGTVKIAPNAGYSGLTSFIYQVHDGELSDTGVVSVLVTNTTNVNTTILNPIADTFVRSGNANQTAGSNTKLQVEHSGLDRALLRFSQNAIAATVGSGSLVQARLRLYIVANGSNWANGRAVGVYRLNQDWGEATATWNCPFDPVPSNSSADNCLPTWHMGKDWLWPFERWAVDLRTIHNHEKNVWVEWDVTPDVVDFLAGRATNYGWVINKLSEGDQGRVHFSSREGANAPQLVLKVVP